MSSRVEHVKKRAKLVCKYQVHNKTVFLDFSETGHFQVMNNNTNETFAIGTWKLLPSGIMWKFPIQQTDSSEITMI
jgi:hypothetical protein